VSGSLSAVGNDPSRPSNESVPFYPFEKLPPYSHTKAGVEFECLRAAVDGLNVVIAVSCAILGPNDFKPSRMGRTLVDFAHGKLRAYIPGGFTFVSARDMVEGHVLAMNKGRRGQKYIFASEFRTVDDLMSLYEDVTGRRRPRLRLPPPVMAGIAEVSSFVLTNFFPSRPQRFTPAAVRFLRMQRKADCTRAVEELGFRPTTIAQAVQEAYECFVRRGVIKQPRKHVLVSRREES
jgi:nucleoside-diphosphate-sugar epimerase